MDSLEAKRTSQQLVYQTAIRLQSVSRLLKDLLVEHVEAGLLPVDGALSRQEVMHALKRMLASAQEVHGHVTSAEDVCGLMFTMFDREQSGRVSARSLRVALIALSSDDLQLKFKGLLNTLGNEPIDRSALRSLLWEVNQILVLVKQEQEQEQEVFGSVEEAVRSCFDGVSTPTVSHQHALLWLQSEPRLLLWLPAVYRLLVSENMSHNVRCFTCKRHTITGLRFRCQKCLNVHVCLSCFLTGRQRKKHKALHPLLEFYTQPTWRETLSSLARSTRYHMLPWRRTQGDGAWSTQHVWAEPKDTQDRAPPSSEETSILSTDSAPSPAPIQQASHGASVSPTKSHDDQALLSDVRALQRDRSLLEAELQALRLSIETEQGILGNRYSEIEVSVETLRRHNVLLSQALNEIKESQTTSPTILLGTPSPDTVDVHSPIGQETPEEAELPEEYSSESEDDWMSNEEAELQETVDRLKTEMKTDALTQIGVPGAELLKASEQVGVVIGRLVTAVRQSRCKALLFN